MASYYYLMASLPMLRTDGEPPMDYGTFLEMCRGNVADGIFATLEDLTIESDRGSLLREWADFYGVLREELIYQRRVKLSRSAKIPGNRDAAVTAAVTTAVNSDNPLVAEKILLQLEFEKLDEMVGYHNFDERALYGYAMKLQLLERQRTFDRKTGEEEFQTLLDDLRQQVFSM